MKHALWMMISALALVACDDGDSDSGGGTFNTSLDDNQSLAAVTDADAQSLCESSQAAVASLLSNKTQLCTFVAAQLTPDKATCQQAVTQCVDSPESAAPDDSKDCSTAKASDLMECDLTVGEFELCINAYIGKVRSLMGSASCDRLSSGEPDLSSLLPTPQSLPECAPLVSQCPKLFDSSDDDAEAGGNP